MKKKRFLLLSLSLLISVAFLIGCRQNGDDSALDDDSAEDDDWDKTDDGCEYVIDGSKNQTKDGLEDCVPELPENVDPEPIFAILEAYLGAYLDGNDAGRIITCRLEGIWYVPDLDQPEGSLCDFFWGIPVWVTFDEDDITVEGSFSQAYFSGIPSDPTSWPEADLGFVKDSVEYMAIREHGTEHVQWRFEVPIEWTGVIWTKVD